MAAFGLSVMPEAGFARASLPLFEDGVVDAVEWSFDMGWHPKGMPAWLSSLLDDYSNQGALVGHGVSYSVLGAAGHHDRWLSLLQAETESREYQWISEHVGFVGAGRFSFSAPLPVPVNQALIALGQQRMIDLKNAAGCEVGIENLATCLGQQDAVDQGTLIKALLQPVDGFMVLDLHNLYCQGLNVGLDPITLMAQLPLDRVREVHVSGGSWSETSDRSRRIRRDTHDGLVPDDVLDLLGVALMRCDNLELVIYERLGNAFEDPTADDPYRNDVRRVATVVSAAGDVEPRAPSALAPFDRADESQESTSGTEALASYQAALLDVLADGKDGAQSISQLMADQPSWAADIAGFDADLVEVASALTKTWGRLLTS